MALYKAAGLLMCGWQRPTCWQAHLHQTCRSVDAQRCLYRHMCTSEHLMSLLPCSKVLHLPSTAWSPALSCTSFSHLTANAVFTACRRQAELPAAV